MWEGIKGSWAALCSLHDPLFLSLPRFAGRLGLSTSCCNTAVIGQDAGNPFHMSRLTNQGMANWWVGEQDKNVVERQNGSGVLV